ncbi:u4 tri-snrnp-associated [Apiospora arundinis]|uniref:U4 tri-snrnp-associated n=1 Tax=Apiospora arundinis TaxID=335852 RepID=A0ABR2I2S3_9PEZI
MADNPRRGGRDRGGYGGRRDGPRDNRRDDPDNDRYQDRRAARDDRHRTRSASPRRDRRDRSRDRRDRDGGRDRGGRDNRQYQQRGDRGHDRGYGGRDRDRDRDFDRRRRDDRDEPRSRYRDEDAVLPSKEGSRREGSPPRRANPPEHSADLPTRSKQQSDRGSNTPLSFRVGKGDESSRASQGRDIGKASEERRHSPQHENDIPMGDDHREEEDEDDVDVEADMDMAAMMGFGGFGTTKNTHVKGNNAGGVRKEKKTEYRQYMNRIGGFNRPLSPGHQ